MELTDNQRAVVGRYALRLYEHDRPGLSERGPAAREARKRQRDKLRRLREAWQALDAETQADLIGHMVREWSEYDPGKAAADGKRLANPMPDLGCVAGMLEKALTRPENQTEDHPGFTDALLYLWPIWCQQQMGGHVPIESAVAPLAGVLAPLFALHDDEAQRRVRDRLYGLSKAGRLERRPTAL